MPGGDPPDWLAVKAAISQSGLNRAWMWLIPGRFIFLGWTEEREFAFLIPLISKDVSDGDALWVYALGVRHLRKEFSNALAIAGGPETGTTEGRVTAKP